MNTTNRLGTLLILLSMVSITPLYGQQMGDPGFNPVIKNPAYPEGEGPVIAIDGAHNNFHTIDGRYAPFARLLEKDGFRLTGFDKKFTQENLAGVDILVISNALNDEDVQQWVVPNPSAFTDEEIDALVQWVEKGGSLFLIADHMPFPGAAEELAARFGFTFNNGFAFDTTRQGPMVFSKENGLLQSDPITEGIDSVASFTGQGFQIPDGARPLLLFGSGVLSLMPDTAWAFSPETPRISLGGWSQGAVMPFGNGRLAVFGEAAMFTAQVAGPNRIKMGMNADIASQNYLFLIKLVRWLAGG